MTEATKIDLRYRRMNEIGDVTDLVGILFPGNRNRQHAAARILLALKPSRGPLPSLGRLQEQYGISRRTFERTRAKLARLGLIEHVGWMSRRYSGEAGWKLSGRMSTALRQLADRIDEWRKDTRPERSEKDERLVGLLR